MPEQWTVIENTPGYMPDDNDPPVFDEYADAVEYLNDRCVTFGHPGFTA